MGYAKKVDDHEPGDDAAEQRPKAQFLCFVGEAADEEGAKGKADQIAKGWLKDIHRSAAAGKNGQADQTDEDVEKLGIKGVFAAEQESGERAEKKLQGKGNNRGRYFYKGAHGCQGSK